MVARRLRRRSAIVASILLGGCIVPVEPRLEKLGAYHLELRFVEETRQQDTHTVTPTSGRISGILVIRERGVNTGTDLPIEAEFRVLSCEGLQTPFCVALRFRSDASWGGRIDSPTGDGAKLQLLLAGDLERWMELDGTFGGGEFSGTVLLRVQGFCCANPTQTWARGSFKAAK